MARYIDVDKFIKDLQSEYHGMISDESLKIYEIIHRLGNEPTADVVEVETLKAWLYEIAINNVGCVLDGDFSDACQEIISRLYGLRKFAQERK